MTPPDDAPAPWRNPDAPMPAGSPASPVRAPEPPPATPNDEPAGERRGEPPAALPSGDGGAKKPPKKTGGGGDGGGGKGSNSAGRTPNKIGLEILQNMQIITDENDNSFLYTDTDAYWRRLTEHDLDSIAFSAESVFATSSKRRAEIVKFVKAKTRQRRIEWSCIGDEEIPFLNGVLNVRTGDMRSHRATDMLEHVLPYEFRPGAECPEWQRVLGDWFGKATSEEAMALQEFFGYILLPHAKFKKALVCHGKSNTGKSLVPFILRQLVGPDFVCTLAVEHMDNPVRRFALRGKLLNIITEVSSTAVVKDDGFKALVSQEDPVMIEQKFKDAYTYLPRAKHVICGNNLFRVNDKTEATIGRLLVVAFARVFSDDEQDMALGKKLLTELPGIALWSVVGAKRLISRGGRFLNPPSGEKLLDELRAETNPMRDFLREEAEISAGTATPLKMVRTRFNEWNHGERPIGPKQIGKRLREIGCKTMDVKLDGRTHKCLVGFRLLTNDTVPELHVPTDAHLTAAEETDGWRPGSRDAS